VQRKNNFEQENKSYGKKLGPTEKVRNAADARRQGEAVYLILRAAGNKADIVFLANEKTVIFNNQL
jgi:hypothetical protein